MNFSNGKSRLNSLRRLYSRLHLRINEDKTAVASVFKRKFLGFSLWVAAGGEVKRTVAKTALKKYRHQIRRLTRRSCGRSLEEVIEKLRAYMPGWKGYFQLAQTPRVFRELDEWLRHRLRALQLKQWKRGKTIYRELKALGASEENAAKAAARPRSWWRSSRQGVHLTLTVAYFDRLGVPRLA